MSEPSTNLFDLWDFGDPAASEIRFRDVAASADTELNRAMALTQVARALGLQSRFDEARQALAEADLLITDHGVGRAQYWVELGRVENSSGNPSGAMPHFQLGLDLAQASGAEYLTVDAAHMLAIAAPADEQPKYAEAALNLAKSSIDERARRWVGPIVNNLGWTYFEKGKPEIALRWFEESLEFRLSQGVEAPIRMARYSVGCALRACGRVEEALATQEVALAMGGSIGFIEEEIGECLYALGQTEEAKPYFKKAHELLTANTDLPETEPERLQKLLHRA